MPGAARLPKFDRMFWGRLSMTKAIRMVPIIPLGWIIVLMNIGRIIFGVGYNITLSHEKHGIG